MAMIYMNKAVKQLGGCVLFLFCFALTLRTFGDPSIAAIQSRDEHFASPQWRNFQYQQLNKIENLLKKVSRLEAAVARSSQQVSELACEKGGDAVTLSGGYCLNPNNVITGFNHLFDGTMCAGVEEIVGNSSIGDFGAGLGHYGRCFQRINQNVIHSNKEDENKQLDEIYQYEMTKAELLGKPQVIKSWKGYDGAGNIQTVSKGFIKHIDLAVEFDLEHRFDWIISLEVGEHIPAEFQHIFINNLITHACKGVILTWAIPGQGGHYHVNNREHQEIIDEFQSLGMVQDMTRQNKLNNRASFDWFKRCLVFKFPVNKNC